MTNYTLKDRKLSIIAMISIIGLWIFISKFVNNQVIIPSLKNTFASIIVIIREPDFLNIVISSLFRTLIGFLVSLSLAILTAILSSLSKIIYNLMLPILKFLNSVPTIAIIILALIWLKNGTVPIFVGFLMVFPLLYEAVLNSILNVDQDIVQMAKLYKVKKTRIIKDIYVPNILYNLSSIFNTVIGINLKMVIAGEVLAQPKYGIGSNLQLQRMYLNTSGVFAWIVIILLISTTLDLIGKVIRKFQSIKRWK